MCQALFSVSHVFCYNKVLSKPVLIIEEPIEASTFPRVLNLLLQAITAYK